MILISAGTAWDLLVLTSALLWLLGLTASGALAPGPAGLALAGLVVALTVASAVGSSVARLTLRIGLPVVGLISFVVGSDSAGALARRAALLVLIPVIFGFYLMLRTLLR